jgi:hypothetical protein
VDPIFAQSVAGTAADGSPDAIGVSVLDDFSAVGNWKSLIVTLRKLQQNAAAVGLKLNIPKCHILWPHGTTPPAELVAECSRLGITLDLEGVKLLGGCVTFDDCYREQFLTAEVQSKSAFFDRLLTPSLPSSYALRILSTCGIPRMSYLMQIVRPRPALQPFLWFDRLTVRTICTKLGIDVAHISPAQRKQLHLPLREGGLGITRSSFNQHAFLSSALTMIQDLPHSVFDLICQPNMPALRFRGNPVPTIFDSMFHAHADIIRIAGPSRHLDADFNAVLMHYRVSPPNRLQHELRHVANLLADDSHRRSNPGNWAESAVFAPSAADLARIRSCSAKGASMFLTTNPSKPELFMSDRDLSITVRQRLGMLPVDNLPDYCACGKPFAADPDHLSDCNTVLSGGGAAIYRHNMIVNRLASLCRLAHVSVKVEPRSDDKEERKRPDLKLQFLRARVFVDVAVTHPPSESYRNAAARINLAAAAHTEVTKHSRYDAFAAREHGRFIPFILESFGAFGKECRTLINSLAREAEHARVMTQREFKGYAYRTLSVDLQRGNAYVVASGANMAYDNSARPGRSRP